MTYAQKMNAATERERERERKRVREVGTEREREREKSGWIDKLLNRAESGKYYRFVIPTVGCHQSCNWQQ